MRLYLLAAVCGSIVWAACGGGGEDRNTAITVSSDFRTIVGGALAQYQREVEASCPCRVEEGAFQSNQACIQKLGHTEQFVECASRELKESDDRELRVALHCAMERYAARAECVETNGCDLASVTTCTDEIEECPVVNPQALTRVLTQCPGGTLLSR